MNQKQLEREARIFSRYLTGLPATGYVADKYAAYHRGQPMDGDPFDRFLVGIASLTPALTRIADCYAVRFRKGAALRKKLALVLALSECTPPTSAYLDGADGSGISVWWKLAGWTGVHIASSVVGLLLLPFHAALARKGGGTR
jgi:hypothetical protein